MPRRPGNNTNAKAINRAERDNRALELRKSGETLQRIANACGYCSASHAQQAIVKKIREIPRQNAEDVRTIEMERLDRMFLALWKKVKEGDEGAIETSLKVMARRSKLMGLDAPLAVDLKKADEDIQAIREHLGDITPTETAGAGEGPEAG